MIYVLVVLIIISVIINIILSRGLSLLFKEDDRLTLIGYIHQGFIQNLVKGGFVNQEVAVLLMENTVKTAINNNVLALEGIKESIDNIYGENPNRTDADAITVFAGCILKDVLQEGDADEGS